jgi:ferredoxin
MGPGIVKRARWPAAETPAGRAVAAKYTISVERVNRMKATVNKDLCIGCGLCVDVCPEVFEMNDDKAQAKVNPVPTELEGGCREAAAQCPVEAITIEDV